MTTSVERVAELLRALGCSADAMRMLMPNPPEIHALPVDDAGWMVVVLVPHGYQNVGRVIWKGATSPITSSELLFAIGGVLHASVQITRSTWHAVKPGDYLAWSTNGGDNAQILDLSKYAKEKTP